MNKLLYFLMIVVFMINCKKDDSPTNDNTSPIIADFQFDIEDDLADWQLMYSDSAIIDIDHEVKYSGDGSLKIYNECTSLSREDGINVEANTNYEIVLHAKCLDFITGEGSCGYAYNLALVVTQGTEDDWYSIWNNSEDWYEKKLYFSSDDTGLPIKLRILMGQKVCWIDEFTIEKID